VSSGAARRVGHEHGLPADAAIIAIGGDVASRSAIRPAILLPARDEVARIGWVGVDPGLDLGFGIVDAGLARDIIGSAVREWTWPGNLPQLSEFLGLRRQGSSGKQKSSDHKQDPVGDRNRKAVVRDRCWPK
jgi:hypothetical protein